MMERVQCRAERHGSTQHAYIDDGCRCEAARAAYAAWCRKFKRVMGPQVDTDGNCVAARHGTHYAYRYRGCRCPEAVALNDQKLALARQDRHRRKAPAADLGGMHAAPWRGDWRGRDMRVDRIELEMTVAGFRLPVSYGTRVAAVITLSRIQVPDRDHPFTGRGLYGYEIAERLGVDERLVQRYKAWPAKARRQRAARRLADVKDRATKVARAIERENRD